MSKDQSSVPRRELIRWHSVMFSTVQSIRPGVFIIGTGEGFRYRPVEEGDTRYCGLALDQPRVGTNGVMGWSDDANGSPASQGVGRMGEFAWVDGTAVSLGHDGAERAWHTAVVLERLLNRFRFDPRHEQTGFLAESEERTGKIFSDMSANAKVLWHNCPPVEGVILTSRHGCYSSHRRCPEHPFDSDRNPEGYAGNLTLTGQICCLGGVFRSRLAEFLRLPPANAGLPAITRFAGLVLSPLEWADPEVNLLSDVRGELCRWSGRAAADDGKGERRGAETAMLTANHGTEPSKADVTSNDETDDEDIPALTQNDTLVLLTMARFDGSRLLPISEIAEEMDAAERLSVRTIGPIVRKLVDLDLAERPDGERTGARLNVSGRRHAQKIAD